jgi:endoglucanase
LKAIEFWMFGPASSYTLSLGLAGTNVGAVQAFTIPHNSWTQVSFSMQSLGVTGKINRIAVQSTNADATSVFFDDVVFVSLAAAAAAVPPRPLVVFADKTTWRCWSWGAVVNYAATSPVRSGTRSIGVRYEHEGGALSLVQSTAADIKDYSAIRFWVYGPASSFAFSVQQDGTTLGTAASFSIPANTWTRVRISVEELGATSSLFNRLTFQLQATTQPKSLVFFDDIALLP